MAWRVIASHCVAHFAPQADDRCLINIVVKVADAARLVESETDGDAWRTRRYRPHQNGTAQIRRKSVSQNATPMRVSRVCELIMTRRLMCDPPKDGVNSPVC